MKKVQLNTVLALMMMAASFAFAGTTAYAQDEPAKVEWSVTYTGSGMDSTYDANKAKISNVMPGDTIEYTVQYINGSNDPADFYMNADVVKSLEDGATATGGAYSYKITYSGSTEPLFDSETVGGDETAEAKVGLNQVEGNEGAYFSLGTVEAGESGNVTISIALDGNSQSNNYMATLAELQIKFGAEPTSSRNDSKKIEEHESVVKRIVNKLEGGTEIVVIEEDDIPLDGGTGSNPQTGDSILPLVFCGIALLIGLLMIVWYFMITRKQNEEVA